MGLIPGRMKPKNIKMAFYGGKTSVMSMQKFVNLHQIYGSANPHIYKSIKV